MQGKIGAAFQAARKQTVEAGQDQTKFGRIARDTLATVGRQYQDTIANIRDMWQQGEITGKRANEAVALATARYQAKAQQLGRELGKQELAAQKVAQAHRALGFAFLGTTGALLGFIRAGLAETAQGEQISLQMRLISREIAGLFAPAINTVVHKLAQVRGWFQSLTGDQQAFIANTVTAGVAALGFAVVLPKIVSGIEAVGSAMKVVMAANPILLAVAAVVGLLAATEEGREAFASLFEAFVPIIETVVDLVKDLAKAFSSVLAPVLKFIASLLKPIVQAVGGVLRFVTGGNIRTLADEGRSLAEQVNRGELTEQQAQAEARRRDQAAQERFQQRGQLEQSLALVHGAINPFGAQTVQEQLRFRATQEALRREMERTREDRRQLEQRGGGFESLTATFARIQTAINRTNFTQQTANNTQQIAQHTQQLVQLAQRGAGFLGQNLNPWIGP